MIFMKINRFFPKAENFEGVEAIMFECGRQGIGEVAQIAYILATVKHESAGTMQPIEEFGKGHNRTYGHRVWHSGKPYSDVPFIYYGAGFVQITWRDNYMKLSKAAKKQGFDWDFEHHPELALQIGPSAWASVYAMKVGMFTGKKLSDYINDKKTDWIGARKIINGKDKAELIASYAKEIYNAIKQ